MKNGGAMCRQSKLFWGWEESNEMVSCRVTRVMKLASTCYSRFNIACEIVVAINARYADGGRMSVSDVW